MTRESRCCRAMMGITMRLLLERDFGPRLRSWAHSPDALGAFGTVAEQGDGRVMVVHADLEQDSTHVVARHTIYLSTTVGRARVCEALGEREM